MKRISAVILAVLTVICVLPFTSHAAGTYVIENPTVLASLTEPTIDGIIDYYEGWSTFASFNTDTAAPFWRFMAQTTSGGMAFAYSERGLYFAAEMSELSHLTAPDQNGVMRDYDGNGFIYCTGEDAYGEGRISEYGWNGDVITLMLDPGRIILNNSRNNSVTMWYNIGLFNDGDGDYTRVYRSQVNTGEITDLVESAGKRYGNRWTVEIMIPWEIIAEDVNLLSPRLHTDVTADELASGRYLIHAGVMYMDRFYDAETQTVETWGRYVTVCERCPDGTPGYATSGPLAKSLGLKISMCGPFPYTDVMTSAWYSRPILLCRANGYMSGVGGGLFAPFKEMTRAEFVTALAAFDETDISIYGGSSFTDVPAGKWYSKPVGWAYSFGYVSGVGGGAFAPNKALTHEELAQLLYTYAKKNGYDVSAGSEYMEYIDPLGASAWAKRAMCWGLAEGLILPDSEMTISPKGPVLRAEAAEIIVRFAEFCGIELTLPQYIAG